MRFRFVLGIMSGTSLDGLDLALCRIREKKIVLEEHRAAGFPAALERRLQRACQGSGSIGEIARLHHDLGRFYARAAAPFAGRAELIGLHGQTVYHQPGGERPATLQLGEPAYLAERLGVPVVSNFRAADLAAGGEGAPLATLFHWLVFGRRGQHICVQNLGGIGNVTSIHWKGRSAPRILAFDTGPGNLLINLAILRLTAGRRHYDPEGRYAARGRADLRAARRWLAHPFFRKPPPKSTGRELFGDRFVEQALREMKAQEITKDDMLATLTEFTVRSIVENYVRHLPGVPDAVFLCGGGARNRTLTKWFADHLAAQGMACPVRTTDAAGWPAETVEASAFALLADYRVRGTPGNVPATTGAAHPVLLGQVTGAGGNKQELTDNGGNGRHQRARLSLW